jgi:hypothetical protein
VTLNPEETDDVLRMIDRLSAKHGWDSYRRRIAAIRDRIRTDAGVPTLPPLPAGSIIDPDAPRPVDNFTPCDGCESPSVCSTMDSCGRGR